MRRSCRKQMHMEATIWWLHFKPCSRWTVRCLTLLAVSINQADLCWADKPFPMRQLAVGHNRAAFPWSDSTFSGGVDTRDGVLCAQYKLIVVAVQLQCIAERSALFILQDLYDSISAGDYPEWKLMIQTMDPADEDKFDFAPLDDTKTWPEDIFPLQPVGRMVLNKNPDNFFNENEQVAYCPALIVPG